MAKYTIDAVLEVWGSFDVEADSFGEAYRKAAENPGKYANLKVWNDGAEAQLRTYNHINCVGECPKTEPYFLRLPGVPSSCRRCGYCAKMT